MFYSLHLMPGMLDFISCGILMMAVRAEGVGERVINGLEVFVFFAVQLFIPLPLLMMPSTVVNKRDKYLAHTLV